MDTKKILLALAVIFSFGLIGVVHATTFVYDDFSGGSLDMNKWQFVSNQLQQVYVDSQNQVLHVEQVTAATSDIYTMLRMTNYSFYPGDVLEYDAYHYASSSGSHLSEHSAWNYYGNRFNNEMFSIGYWAGSEILPLGDETGNYHYVINVGNSSFTVTVTGPGSSIHTKQYLGQSPFKFGINTEVAVWQGTGGTIHIDYDNFVISTNVPLPVALDQRVSILEQQVANLTQQNQLLQQQLDNQTSVIDNILNRLSLVETKVARLVQQVSQLLLRIPKIEQSP